MKTCLVCTDTRQPDEAETCSLCGESSWAEAAPVASSEGKTRRRRAKSEGASQLAIEDGKPDESDPSDEV